MYNANFIDKLKLILSHISVCAATIAQPTINFMMKHQLNVTSLFINALMIVFSPHRTDNYYRPISDVQLLTTTFVVLPIHIGFTSHTYICPVLHLSLSVHENKE